MIRQLLKYNIVNYLFWPAFRYLPVLFLFFFFAIASAQGRTDVAMVTALQGKADLITPQGMQALQPFSRLKRGDQIALDSQALKVIFFESGRQEIWQGTGKIEILDTESRGLGLSHPDVKVLPGFMVRQIAKTPSTGATSRNGNSRLRSIEGGGSLERIEESYRRMRKEADQGDLNPELFLLSALFEIREIARVEQVLADLRMSHPADQEARVVISLYQKALRNMKEGGAKP